MKFSRILFLLLVTSSSSKESKESSSEKNLPLFLTPLIKEGKISTAQKLAAVLFPRHENLLIPETQWPQSYSGFITVNEDLGTNLFFWFFPAKVSKQKYFFFWKFKNASISYFYKNNSESAPVLFWSDGGPGATLFHSLFNLHGPLKFNSDRKLVGRHDNASLHSEFNVIYLDNPAGVGKRLSLR